ILGPRLRPRGCGSGALLDRFGVLVQALLAVAAFGTLMLKRFKEPKAERRPWRIWFYDTSKQAIGAVFIHVANVFLSDLTEEDPCSLYLMNFLLDATLGMLGVWTGVKVVSWIVERRKYTHLVFGEYGDPPQAGAWIGQCTLYLLIMVFAKTAVGLLLLIPGWRKLQEILLDYMPDPQMELVLMMLVVPFTVNAATFWVVDSLIMKKHKQKEILKFESSRRMEDSQALKEEQYQVRTQRHFCHCFKKLSLDSLCLKCPMPFFPPAWPLHVSTSSLRVSPLSSDFVFLIAKGAGCPTSFFSSWQCQNLAGGRD
uniref:Transmembrane protein 110 n=1 Tax=Varanus komodoensis TaxID=61221 RepID=A0A8D2L0B5_VARKO